ncbi:MAG: MarR family transcriptional regulator [Patescibacteria group bacterium]|nr:MarR family transcriptional regulator [Patescibacteria group bacterium]
MNRRQQLEEFWEDVEILRRKTILCVSALLAKHDLTHPQGLALLVLGDHEGLGVKDIAGFFGVTSSAATQLLDGLLKKGYIQRKQNSTDRRALVITLTPKARRFFVAMKKHQLALSEKILSVLNDSELSNYAKYMKKIVEQMEAMPIRNGSCPLH